jgi:hypothetical protein
VSTRNGQDTQSQSWDAQERKAPSGPPSSGDSLAGEVWDNVRGGASHFQQRKLPPPGHPIRQFFHGLSLPFHLHRALWAQPEARRRYLKVGILQSLVILALAFTFGTSTNEAVDAAKGRDRSERAAEKEKAQHLELVIGSQRFVIGGDDEPSSQGEGEQKPVPDAKAAASEAHEGEESSLARRFGIPNLAFWAALFAAVQVAQWVVIALSRDFHDSVSRDASLLTGLEPEDPEVRPRIRLDTKWLRNKFSRRIRAFTVFAAGLPVLYAASAPLPFGNKLASVLISGWSAYWLVVFTTAKTAHAWRDGEAGPPWFLRGWTWLTTRVPGFRWGLLQRWGRFWENRTRSVFPPAAEMEKQPWAFAGLAVTRTVSMIPLVKCFLRPLIPVAAAHLIVARRITEGDSKAEASALPAPPPASGPEA